MKKSIKSWLLVIVTAVILATLINQLLFFLIIVPSGSMYPTIKPKDRILTTRMYNTEEIERGDILVFYSDELQETMVKRVIGLPNDLVEIKEGGTVYINNQKLNEPYVKDFDQQTGTYKVPNNEYFFLGDYRSHSYDSRKWEDPFISEENIAGKAQFIVFPFNRASHLYES